MAETTAAIVVAIGYSDGEAQYSTEEGNFRIALDSKLDGVGCHAFSDTLSHRWLNPIKQSYDAPLPDGRLR